MAKITLNSAPLCRVKENGIVSISTVADGRYIPGVLLTCNNDFIKYLVDIHKAGQTCDIVTVWTSQVGKPQYFDLLIEFKSPVDQEIAIRFNINEHHMLIDAIMQSKGLYIGFWAQGKKVSNSISDSFLIEVTASKVEDFWNKTLNKVLTKKLLKCGVSKKGISKVVKGYKSEMRSFTNSRPIG